MLTLLLLGACGDKDPDTGASSTDTGDSGVPLDTSDTGDTGEGGLPDGMVGTIDFHTFGELGEVNIQKAFGLAQDKKFIAYFSNNPKATCDDVVTYLTPTDKAEDPSDFLTPGHCDMFMSLEWADGFEHEDELLYVAGFAISCPLADGKFVYEKRDKGDYDFYWTGLWWQGHPQDYQISITEETDGYTFTGMLTTFKGNLIYEDVSTYTGVGKVQGILEIERCDDIAPLHKIY
ncbi:MAG: hypothetical protein ACI8RZ_004357 [Myxococcota bacterium]|jgi:hypothetical protein